MNNVPRCGRNFAQIMLDRMGLKNYISLYISATILCCVLILSFSATYKQGDYNVFILMKISGLVQGHTLGFFRGMISSQILKYME